MYFAVVLSTMKAKRKKTHFVENVLNGNGRTSQSDWFENTELCIGVSRKLTFFMAAMSLLLSLELTNFKLVLYFFLNVLCSSLRTEGHSSHQRRVGSSFAPPFAREEAQKKKRASKKIPGEKTGVRMSVSKGQATSLHVNF